MYLGPGATYIEEFFTGTYKDTAPQDRAVVLALWQLRQRFVITDSAGEP